MMPDQKPLFFLAEMLSIYPALAFGQIGGDTGKL